MCERLSLSILVVLAPLALTRAGAADLAPLTSVQLHELCREFLESPESERGLACSAYVRGFIEGSAEAVLRTPEASATRAEAFSERAWRTRLGSGAPPPPKYCLHEGISVRDFIVQVLEHAKRKPPQDDVSASALLYGTLSRFYRCPR